MCYHLFDSIYRKILQKGVTLEGYILRPTIQNVSSIYFYMTQEDFFPLHLKIVGKMGEKKLHDVKQYEV